MSPRVFGQLLKQTGLAWSDNNATRLGAALAFYSVLSLSPLLVLALSAASAIWGTQAAQDQIIYQVREYVGRDAADAIRSILAAASHAKTDGLLASLIGFCSLIFSASGAFGELQNSMNTIWKVQPPEGQPVLILIRDRFFSIIMLVSSGFLLVASMIISAIVAAMSQYVAQEMPLALVIMHLVNLTVSFAVVTLLFALIFKTVPDTVVPWKGVWGGAVMTTLLFIVGKTLIGLYLGRAGLASSYGAAGSIVVLLLWVYYTAQILFFGAEFTYIYVQYKGWVPATANEADVAKPVIPL